MQKRLTISELAQAADVPASTIRYYDRVGLVRPAGRTRGNYRFYTPEARERLRFIRAAQATGFRLEDIAALLQLRDRPGVPCREVQDLIETRLSEVRTQLANLRQVEEHLDCSLQICRAAEPARRCAVIECLSQSTSG